MTAETKSQDNKNKVGNRRSQAGNKGGRRLKTKEAKSSVEITRRTNFKGNFLKTISAVTYKFETRSSTFY